MDEQWGIIFAPLFNMFTKIILSVVLILFFYQSPLLKSEEQKIRISDCSYAGYPLQGNVQFVHAFPDLKIQVVSSFPDLKVKLVNSFPNDCGEWAIVSSFPNLKVQKVDAFPDLRIQYVDAFPGWVD